jgi:hypothetical protein
LGFCNRDGGEDENDSDNGKSGDNGNDNSNDNSNSKSNNNGRSKRQLSGCGFAFTPAFGGGGSAFGVGFLAGLKPCPSAETQQQKAGSRAILAGQIFT